MTSLLGLSLEIDKSQQSESKLLGLAFMLRCSCSLLFLVASKSYLGKMGFLPAPVFKKGAVFSLGFGVFWNNLLMDRKKAVFLLMHRVCHFIALVVCGSAGGGGLLV